jgi:tetratricopeptide (TPR) repeat protein
MGRYQELFAFADDSMIAAAPLEYRGKLAAIKASGLYYSDQYEAAIVTARQALKWEGPGVMPYWTLAIASFDLGRMDQAVRWLAKAKAAQKPTSKASFTAFGNNVALTQLDRLLKDYAYCERTPLPLALYKPRGTRQRIEPW